MSERDAIDLRPWGYAPGGYFFRCIDCPPPKNLVDGAIGAKRSSRCEMHALAAKEADERGEHLPASVASVAGDDAIAVLWAAADNIADYHDGQWGLSREIVDAAKAKIATHAGEVERLREAIEILQRLHDHDGWGSKGYHAGKALAAKNDGKAFLARQAMIDASPIDTYEMEPIDTSFGVGEG